jgi:asparagine synthase (glutamine-hydrolysing)
MRRARPPHTWARITPSCCVSAADALAVVPHLPRLYDEPFADSSQVPTVLLSQLTRRHVTVALSGDAGDELFGGYNRYLFAAFMEPRLRRWPQGLRHALAAAMRMAPASLVDAVAGFARRHGAASVPPGLGEKVARLAQFIGARSGQSAYLGTVSQWMNDAPLRSPASEPVLDDLPGTALPQRMMWWDMQTYLPDDILVKVDRAAMASSLETRVPFLDHRIVEFALRQPLHAKIRSGRSKWLLRELLARHLPATMFERPKQGFSVPLDVWLRGPLRDWAESLLDERRLRDDGFLVPGPIRSAWASLLAGDGHWAGALWNVLMWQAWRQEVGAR